MGESESRVRISSGMWQDAVARGGKLLWLYKRPGHRVMVNAYGDLIVRPPFFEASRCLDRGRSPSTCTYNSPLGVLLHRYMVSLKEQDCNAQLTEK